MTNINSISTWREYIRMVFIIYGAILIGTLKFFGIAIYLYVTGEMTHDPELVQTLLYIMLPVGVGSILAGSAIAQRRLNSIFPEHSLKEKLETYRAAMVIKLALYEAPVLYILVAFIVTQEIYFAFLFGIFILLLLLNFPTSTRIVNALNLTDEEKLILRNNEPIKGG